MKTPSVPQAPRPVSDLQIRKLFESIEESRPLDKEQILTLLCLKKKEDLASLQALTHQRRLSQVGDAVSIVKRTSLFWTNLCELSPNLYPYPKQLGDKGVYRLSQEQVDIALELAQARQCERLVLSIGGFYASLALPGLEAPTLLKTYQKILSYVQDKAPQLLIEGFSPDEVEFLSVVSGRSIAYVLAFLKDHGLTVLGGFGTELLLDAHRQRISPKKALVKTWFEIAEAAYQLGLPMEARLQITGLETLAQRADHWQRLQKWLEKHPGAFCRVVPQAWTRPPVHVIPGAQANLFQLTHRQKVIAANRILLGEYIPQQEVIWLPNETEEAQAGLHWGASSLGGNDALAYHQFLMDSRVPEYISTAELQTLSSLVGENR